MLKYIYLIIFLGMVLSFYVWQQTQVVRLGYKIEDLKKQSEKWDQENRALRLQVSQLLSMERLDKVASKKNMVAPDASAIVYLSN